MPGDVAQPIKVTAATKHPDPIDVYELPVLIRLADPLHPEVAHLPVGAIGVHSHDVRRVLEEHVRHQYMAIGYVAVEVHTGNAVQVACIASALCDYHGRGGYAVIIDSIGTAVRVGFFNVTPAEAYVGPTLPNLRMPLLSGLDNPCWKRKRIVEIVAKATLLLPVPSVSVLESQTAL